jgi:peptidoglycan/LPS O-acetylase OafA/YrhL
MVAPGLPLPVGHGRMAKGQSGTGTRVSDRTQSDKLTGLQALRFFAAFSVFMVHMVNFGTGLEAAKPVGDIIFAYGPLGVQLFYVLSAFAMMYSTRAYAGTPNWLLQFYSKRFFRIAPLFYVMCAVTTAYVVYRDGAYTMTPTEIALNVLFVNNLVPQFAASLVFAGWSVSVEMMFYVIFPLIFLYVRSIRVAAILLAVAIVGEQLARPTLEHFRLPLSTYPNFSWEVNLPYFLFGIIAFLIYDRLRTTRLAAPDASFGVVLGYHATFLAIAAAIVTPALVYDGWLRAHDRLDMPAWGAFFTVLVAWVALRPIPGFGWKPLQFLGERSYSLYLVHALILAALSPWLRSLYGALKPSLGLWAMVPISLGTYVLVIAVSVLTYAFIERPGMNLARAISQRLRRGRSASAVAVTPTPAGAAQKQASL